MRAGFPVKKAFAIVRAIIVFFILGVFFLITFTKAETDVNSFNQGLSSNDCQALCQSLLSTAFNYNSCSTFKARSDSINYISQCINVTGPCTVGIEGGYQCIVE